jgi:hypothetical protein
VFRNIIDERVWQLDRCINLVNTAMEDKTKRILDALKSGEFFLTVHAAGRMRQRSVTKADIQACGRNAICCLYQAQDETWRIEGKDLDGETLTVICGIERDVVIVTIF